MYFEASMSHDLRHCQSNNANFTLAAMVLQHSKRKLQRQHCFNDVNELTILMIKKKLHEKLKWQTTFGSLCCKELTHSVLSKWTAKFHIYKLLSMLNAASVGFIKSAGKKVQCKKSHFFRFKFTIYNAELQSQKC